MICLLAAQSAALHGLGPVGAVSIVAALLAQITLLPALLLVAGRAEHYVRRVEWSTYRRNLNTDPGMAPKCRDLHAHGGDVLDASNLPPVPDVAREEQVGVARPGLMRLRTTQERQCDFQAKGTPYGGETPEPRRS